MRIGLAYNEKPDASPASDAYAEWDDPSTIDAVDLALSLFGNVVRLEADQFFPEKLALAHPDIVFNMAEGLHGPSRESHVPALCEYLQIPYTGSDPLTLALTLHKGRTKEILAHRGARRPRAAAASLSAVRKARRGRIRERGFRQQCLRVAGAAGGARSFPPGAIRPARVGRDVSPRPGVHRGDPGQ